MLTYAFHLNYKGKTWDKCQLRRTIFNEYGLAGDEELAVLQTHIFELLLPAGYPDATLTVYSGPDRNAYAPYIVSFQ